MSDCKIVIRGHSVRLQNCIWEEVDNAGEEKSGIFYYRKKKTHEERMEALAEKYWEPERPGGWPRGAFDINFAAMLGVIEKELMPPKAEE